MKTKKFLALLLAAIMVISLVPMAALADDSGYSFKATAPEKVLVGRTVDASVTLTGSDKAASCDKALIKIAVTAPEGAKPAIIATDSNNVDFNLAEIGFWGPPTGFPVAAGYDATTPLKLTFDKVGTYTAKFSLVDLDNEDAVLAESTVTVEVVPEEAPVETDWVYGDGYGKVTKDDLGFRLFGEETGSFCGPFMRLSLPEDSTVADGFEMSAALNVKDMKPDEFVAFSFGINGADDKYADEAFAKIDCAADGSLVIGNVGGNSRYDKGSVLESAVTVSETGDVALKACFAENSTNGKLHVFFFVDKELVREWDSDVDFKDVTGPRYAWAFSINVESGILASADPSAVVMGKVIGVDVVDGTDGYTPVETPVVGQKLTANIKTSDGVIGSYPVNADATYFWHYKDSDTLLGTEAVYTVTSDNLGKVICCDVAVKGYAADAKWKAKGAVDYFTDIATSGYHDWIADAAKAGIIYGYPDHSYRPNNDVTRAQFITMLYRAAGSPEVKSTELEFDDAADIDENYLTAVAWGVENAVVLGYEDNTFRPDVKISRAQMATFMYRYLKDVAEYDFGDVEPCGFADADQVAAPYVDAVNAIVSAGIMNGMNAQTFAPNGTANRGMAATVMFRAYDLMA